MNMTKKLMAAAIAVAAVSDRVDSQPAAMHSPKAGTAAVSAADFMVAAPSSLVAAGTSATAGTATVTGTATASTALAAMAMPTTPAGNTRRTAS